MVQIFSNFAVKCIQIIFKCTLFNVAFFDMGIAQPVFNMAESGVWINFDEQKM